MRHVLCAAVVAAMTTWAGGVIAQQPATSGPSKEGDGPATKLESSSGPPTWMAIPLEGEFGKDVTAAGVVAALNDAKARKLAHIVFVVDSPGGDIEDARAIVESIKPFAAAMKFHCIVKRAEGEALWVVAASADVFVSGKSAAMSCPPPREREPGKAGPDRTTDGYADELATLAEAHGHSPWVFRALITPKSELWLTPGDKPVLSPSKPAAPDARQIDGSESSLALGPNLAVELGFAQRVSELSGDSLGAALGVTPWRSSKNAGAVHMKRGAAELARLLKNLESSRKGYDEAVDEMQRRMERLPAMKQTAAEENPNVLPLEFEYDGKGYKHLSAKSFRLWREQTAKATREWTNIQGVIREAESLRKEALRQADNTFRDAQAALKHRRVAIPKDAKPPEVPKLNFDPKVEMRIADDAIAALRREQGGPR